MHRERDVHPEAPLEDEATVLMDGRSSLPPLDPLADESTVASGEELPEGSLDYQPTPPMIPARGVRPWRGPPLVLVLAAGIGVGVMFAAALAAVLGVAWALFG